MGGFGAGAALAAAALAWTVPALAPVHPPVARALRVPLTLPGPGVTLTFDDGPHPVGTPAVLDRLGDRRAIFFLVGEQVVKDPGLAREIAARGHQVGVHGYRHRNLLRLTPRQVRDDFDRAVDAIGEDEWYRPPYGIFSPVAVAEVRRRGWRPLLWSRWGRDWRRSATPSNIAALALRDVGPGDVILLHDADHYSAPNSHQATIGALDRMLPVLASAGL